MIDIDEFTAIIGTVIGATQRRLDAVSIKVYHDLLSDIPKEVLDVAVRRVACEWTDRYMFPPVGIIREAAAQTMAGKITDLSQAEAWKLAWRSVGRSYDPSREGAFHANGKLWNSQLEYLLDGLLPLVVEAIYAFGATALANSDPNYSRKEFMKIYEQLQARERRTALLPASVKEKIAAIGNGAGRPMIEDLTRRIG